MLINKWHAICKHLKNNITAVSIYGLFLFIMIVVIALKSNYHEDEGYTFGSANSMARQFGGYAFMMPENGVRYDDPKAYFEDYAAVTGGNNFHFSIPWTNQYADVHPPLYYVIVHVVCSFFPGIISKWLGGLINIIFALLTLWVGRKLMAELSASKRTQLYTSLAVVTCSGILVMVIFFRMYMMMMFETTALTYLLLHQIGRNFADKKEYLLWVWKLLFITFCGALTHYYFILFVMLISVVYGIESLVERKWKRLVGFSISVLAGGGLAYLAFPQMLRHVFGEGRGEEARTNLENTSDLWTRVKSFYEILSGSTLGILLGIGLVTVIVYGLLGLLEKDNSPVKSQLSIATKRKYLIIFVVCSAFFFLVAKMAPYNQSRYLSPIFAILLIGGGCGIFDILEKMTKESRQIQQVLAAVLLAAMMLSSWKGSNWEYLYRNEVQALKNTKEYASCDAVCMYDNNWKLFNAYTELSKYNAVTFYEEWQVGAKEIGEAIHTPVGVISYMSYTSNAEKEAFFQAMVDELPQYENYQIIGIFKYSTTAILY